MSVAASLAGPPGVASAGRSALLALAAAAAAARGGDQSAAGRRAGWCAEGSAGWSAVAAGPGDRSSELQSGVRDMISQLEGSTR